MRSDEKWLLLAFYNRPKDTAMRDVVNQAITEGVLVRKRAMYLLDKWADKGWYEYGVSVDLGWLTDEGKEQAAKL
jgi:hypothetical protein